MARAARYILEGTWSGYHNGQRRVAHREVIETSKPEIYSNLSCIQYSDGTTLSISLRKAAPREKVEILMGYRSLIRDALATGEAYVNVNDLQKRKA